MHFSCFIKTFHRKRVSESALSWHFVSTSILMLIATVESFGRFSVEHVRLLMGSRFLTLIPILFLITSDVHVKPFKYFLIPTSLTTWGKVKSKKQLVCRETKKCWESPDQCDQMLERKVAHFFKSRPKCSHINFYLHRKHFQSSPKVGTKIFGLLLLKKRFDKTFENSPIWPHWSLPRVLGRKSEL